MMSGITKLTNWCKAVLGGRRKSARGMPPQGKIKTEASRTRAKIASVIAESQGCQGCGHEEHEDRGFCGEVRQDDLSVCQCAPKRHEDQHLEATEPQDSEEGVITAEASKIFLRYLEGDLEAAKIVHGWAQRESERSMGHGARSASPSGGVHDDARRVDDGYAPGDGA